MYNIIVTIIMIVLKAAVSFINPFFAMIPVSFLLIKKEMFKISENIIEYVIGAILIVLCIIVASQEVELKLVGLMGTIVITFDVYMLSVHILNKIQGGLLKKDILTSMICSMIFATSLLYLQEIDLTSYSVAFKGMIFQSRSILNSSFLSLSLGLYVYSKCKNKTIGIAVAISYSLVTLLVKPTSNKLVVVTYLIIIVGFVAYLHFRKNKDLNGVNNIVENVM
ncbi:MAG: hypothetical protein RR646_01670 [Erysipelotrichaceae bacterium]